MPIKSFLDYISLEKKYSQHTVTAYKNDLVSFQDFCLNEFDSGDVVNINYAQIRNWIVSLVNMGVSNRTINRKISSLKSFYKFLQKTKQLDSSPLVKHKALKVAKRVQVPFSEKEIESVINLKEDVVDFESVRDKLIVELLYSTGMRRNELINLKLSNINYSNQVVKVLGKRNKERYIPLLKSVIESLENYNEFRSILRRINLIYSLQKKVKKYMIRLFIV